MIRHIPSPISEAAMAKLKTHRRTLRPNFLKRMIVGNTDRQLTTPTMAVIKVAFIDKELRMVLE